MLPSHWHIHMDFSGRGRENRRKWIGGGVTAIQN